jgi:nucleoside-diphosphate-sugar epimerase
MFLITGGAGFIGSHLVQELIRYQQDVRVFDNFSSGTRQNLDGMLDRVELIEGDLRDRGQVRQAMKGVRYVLHQAALRSVPNSVDDPAATNEVNVQGTLNVLMAAKDAGVQRVVHASSSSVYGESHLKIQEEDQRPFPISP